MKKLLAILTALAIMLSFCACGKTESTADAGDLLNPFTNTDNSDRESSDNNTTESESSDTVTDQPESSTPAPSDSTPSASTPSASAPSASTPSTSTPSVSTPSASTPSASTPSTTQPTAPAKNEFINSSNNYVSWGDLSIRPYHVYWEGNVLHAKCFVVNGLATPARNINVTNITLKNRSGVIASARFGVMQNAVIGSGNYLVWIFSFAPDAISMQGADLSYLECDASANYNY